MTAARPCVLCFSGHDPSGGAGIHADIEAVGAMGAHALTVITAHTVQDTSNVSRVVTADPGLMRAQAEALLADATIGAVKAGLLGDAAQVGVIVDFARRVSAPLVVDPVLRAGGGAELAGAALVEALRSALPAVEVLTPNAAEAGRLVPGSATLEACGQALLALGARNVLITGGDEPGDPVVNHWYARGQAPRRFAWPRLPERFHGAGCTLASAIAALLARGRPVGEALVDAQAYAYRSLSRASAVGRGRSVPGRRE